MWGQKSSGQFLAVFVLIPCFLSGDLRHPAFSAEPQSAVIVSSLDGRETKMSLEDIAKLPRMKVKAKDEKGKESVWEGTPLRDVLKVAGVKFGEAIRGKALADYLLVEAADGYRVVFSLPEMDPAFTELTFLLADRRDGEPLRETEGRLRIVVPHEKRHAR
jgi:DMSO/TMAO reductase YedYZ molybdopterin-dependent catalytic subunit